MSGEWKESKEQLVELPEISPDCFGLYVQRLYSRTFYIYAKTPNGKYQTTAEQNSKDVELLARAWIPGDVLQVIDFQDAVFDIC
jgi:hypothetical protein